MLTPTLTTPCDLLHKLQRESWRTIHHRNLTHKADHFYNFCVTSAALKDHYFEAKGVHRDAQHTYSKIWSSSPELQASFDIANSAKHFVLRNRRTWEIRQPSTKSAVLSSSNWVDVLLDDQDKLVCRPAPNIPDLAVELSDGRTVHLFELMEAVIDEWKAFLTREGLAISDQDKKTFFGDYEKPG